LNGRRRRITLERRGPWPAPLWLLLPALSTVSSRSEWQPLAEAPTWRGPLPTMSGWSPQRFGWLRNLVMLPLIGPLLYRLNTTLPVLRLMLRCHVWVNSAWLAALGPALPVQPL